MERIVFFDIETDADGKKAFEFGAVNDDGGEMRSGSQAALSVFIKGAKFLCGHNIINHDLKYIYDAVSQANIKHFIDTLLWSPLLFPQRPYHKIGKLYKILSEDEPNNPLFDAKLARELFYDELTAFANLDESLKQIYYFLLFDKREFKDFFEFAGFKAATYTSSIVKALCEKRIREYFADKICANADLAKMISDYPIELAYALALTSVQDKFSITPPWVLKHFPQVENVMYKLRAARCTKGCPYCEAFIDPTRALKRFFSYDAFRTYDGEPLQEKAAAAATDAKSLLAIFPTGGGKSITFQLPALMQGEAVRGLTVVISPLQSLMKDQVDNLEKKGITEAVTINGALDPIERAKAVERVEDGSAHILYISPESLRSKTIETLLLKRNVVRFVIDEAHCFSAWGQDFRVDYLYIGDFINSYQEKKGLMKKIPVSCFTATAKPQVVSDIIDYFREKLALDLVVYKSGAERKNLDYQVYNETAREDKYEKLRALLEAYPDTPTIIYVSRTRRTTELADRLNIDGINGGAVAYHGQMDRTTRIENQDKFMNGEARIIVATTAFGMGVDKDNVGLVVHYDISSSLENYVQESGRAGRKESLKANCFIIFDEEDLNKHFILLNQTKLSAKEINQVYRSIKAVTKQNMTVTKTALEFARGAGWDDAVPDMETRIRTAISALEQSHFVKRGQNNPVIFANSLLAKNLTEAAAKINASDRFASDKEKEDAVRVVRKLISSKSIAGAQGTDGETRVDYISDSLGIVKENVIRVINVMREERILADAKDLVAYIKNNAKAYVSKEILSEFSSIERAVINAISLGEQRLNLKELNKSCEESIPTITVAKLITVLNFYSIKHLIKKAPSEVKDVIHVKANFEKDDLIAKCDKRADLANFIIGFLFNKSAALETKTPKDEIDVLFSSLEAKVPKEETEVEFSCLELKEQYEKGDLLGSTTSFQEIDDALFYLSYIGALRLDGAFLVAYNAMRVTRIEKDNSRKYTAVDYKTLDDYYTGKIQQIHIVGEYARLMEHNKTAALAFVKDYFDLNYEAFLNKYFKFRRGEISRNITPKKYAQLFETLSNQQLKIIKDDASKYIVVAAGPGSGKTKVLVHKIASLFILEDVKREQMLMLTFSRAAATEFKKRLLAPEMLGNAATFIQIATFHSYCFDLLGRVGSLENADEVIPKAVERIRSGEIEINKITKTVLVIDEAQDMSENEFSLIQALIEKNDDMRVIAVGDDDQNIYEFRKSNSMYMRSLITDYHAVKYDLLDNYRSKKNIVALANAFVTKLHSRLKTVPIKPVKTENGEVIITKYKSQNLTVPVVNDILSRKFNGTVCVLTETNDEAQTIAGLLNKNNVSARLIQDSSGFNVLNLVEIRYFIDALNLTDGVYTIDNDRWENAKLKTENEFAQSSSLLYVKKLIKDFEAINPKKKYKTDLTQFINESRLEDFCDKEGAQVIVSTIHKAKGAEFNNVFLVLKQSPVSEDKKRAVYVGLTRAIDNLYIHCNADCFDAINLPDVTKKPDVTEYGEPDEIVLSATHKDVFLGAFYYYHREVNNLKSGEALAIRREENKFFLYSSAGKKVVQLSEKMTKQLDAMEAKGYAIKSASARLIVFWRDTSEGVNREETKIVLPNIYLSR